jgi:ABC-type glycerol-3-phosphate transport system substrate-binding protein
MMKKVMFVLAVATMLVACGGNASVETTNTDSTAVADSSVVVTDSTVAAIPADSVSAN